MKITAGKIGFLVCVFAFFFSSESKSQTTFVRTYNKGNMGYAVREVNGNSYVVAGGTDFYYNWHWLIQSSLTTTSIHLYKTNVSGVLQWERVISKPNTRLIARWLEPTNDGGFIIAGSANTDAVWPPDSNDVVLVKTDGSGMVSWCKFFDSGKDDLGFCVQQTTDGGFILSGFHDAVPLSLTLNTYILLIKTDALGNLLWEKKYQFAVRDLNTHEPFSYVVRQTADGGFIVVGTNVITHPADVEILRTDASGNVLWAKSYEHDASVFRNSVGIDVIETTSGDFVIAGSMDKDSPLHLNYPYFLRISSAGSVIKQRFYETLPVLSFQSGFSSVQQTSDGGFFFTGMGGYSNFGDQAQLLKTDASLNMQWSRVYSMDGLATVGSMSGRETSDGGYVFTGKHQMAGSILMKTNGIGLVACKIPNTLIEYTPSVNVSNWNPSVTSGIVSSSILLNEISPLVDTTVVCPVTVPSLPVELNYFSAVALPGKKVDVQWTTSSEINNDYFIVERSMDKTNFESVGKISGAGNSATERTYSLLDEKPLSSPVSYYRLRQVDYDGAEHFSNEVAVTFSDAPTVFASGNLQDRIIRILINTPLNTNANYSLTDAMGRTICSGFRTFYKGESQVTIDMQNYSASVYFFRFIPENESSIVLKVVYR